MGNWRTETRGSAPKAPMRVGDAVQWTRGGIDHFKNLKKVTGIDWENGIAFVEGEHKGFPIDELSRQVPSNGLSTDSGQIPSPALSTKKASRAQPSLRPPTLMIDLLFGALMLFAFQMGDPNSKSVISRNFDLPTSDETTKNKNQALLPLKPIKSGQSSWLYELPDGRKITADNVVKMASSQKKTPVLLVAKNARVQEYLESEQPLRKLGLKAGLAIIFKRK